MAYCAQQPPKGACWDHNPLITPCKDTFRPPRGTKRCESTLNITRFGHQTLFFRSLLVEVSFNYSKIQWTYSPIGDTGAPSGDVVTYWDLATNRGG